MVPDADLLGKGEFWLGFDGYITKTTTITPDTQGVSLVTIDTVVATTFQQQYLATIGIIEWVNIELGYANGVTLGFKARVLGETNSFMPSLAIGVRSIITSKEMNYYAYTGSDNYTNEVYASFAKSIEPIRMRFHAGFMSVPSLKAERFNPFIAVEEAFGFGLYMSFETFKRAEEYRFSLFANMRFANDKLDIGVGAVDLKNVLFDRTGAFALNLERPDAANVMSPGIWVGFRFHLAGGSGKNKAFQSVDDKVSLLDARMDSVKSELDTMKQVLKRTDKTLASLNKKIGDIIDSTGQSRMRSIVYGKLVELKTAYQAEPYEPEKAAQIKRTILGYRDEGAPVLVDFLRNDNTDRYVRMYCAMLLGELGDPAASDVLLKALSNTGDPDLTIEILIALGRLRETRAMYLMEQLANDPNDAIAMTAQEVLAKLSKETGAKYSTEGKAPVKRAPEPTVIQNKTGPVIVPIQKTTGKSSDTTVSNATKTKLSVKPVVKKPLPVKSASDTLGIAKPVKPVPPKKTTP
jgi:hypothetical protein